MNKNIATILGIVEDNKTSMTDLCYKGILDNLALLSNINATQLYEISVMVIKPTISKDCGDEYDIEVSTDFITYRLRLYPDNVEPIKARLKRGPIRVIVCNDDDGVIINNILENANNINTVYRSINDDEVIFNLTNNALLLNIKILNES